MIGPALFTCAVIGSLITLTVFCYTVDLWSMGTRSQKVYAFLAAGPIVWIGFAFFWLVVRPLVRLHKRIWRKLG